MGTKSNKSPEVAKEGADVLREQARPLSFAGRNVGSGTEEKAGQCGRVDGAAGSRPELRLQDWTRYQNDPKGFAHDVLGSCWWAAQHDVALAVAQHRRVAVKAANGVGKTYLAADLVLWFLYCHGESIVLTTAPTWRQVESLLWQEIAKRHRRVNARVEQGEAGTAGITGRTPLLPGKLLQTSLKIAEGHFAMGLSTDEPVRFQGFHAANLLVVLDEACGVPDEIWDAVEGICVGRNNRVLAISNPLAPSGRFYELFRSSRWTTLTISALAHPNVTAGEETADDGKSIPSGDMGRESFPGAVTPEAIADRVQAWCELVPDGEPGPESATTGEATIGQEGTAALLHWQGKTYRPNGLFRSRVLGEFPDSGDDSLIALHWIEAAMRRGQETAGAVESGGLCVLAVDVARFGSDETVFALRRGDRVQWLRGLRHHDTMAIAGRTLDMARAERADIVAVDGIGIGAGVVDRLRESGVTGLLDVQFGARPLSGREAGRCVNLRAQTYWLLRERLRTGAIALPSDDALRAQLTGLRYFFTSEGKIQIESKDDLKRRGLPSPDRADALAMLFGPQMCAEAILTRPAGIHTETGAVAVHWRNIDVW